MSGRVTPDQIRKWKHRQEGLPALTAYDFPTARWVDNADIPILLVGDSLGMVVLGYPDTTYVTMEDMIHHVRAVARARPKSLVVADMPIHSYDTPQQAVENAFKFIDAGADAVKLEGGTEISAQVEALAKQGIPFMGHIGMLPQSIRKEGKYRVKGKSADEEQALIKDAQFLDKAGAFCIVLELVVPELAARITSMVSVPTLGIGSGYGTDGQIRVFHDIVGLFPWFRPKFVRPRVECGEIIAQALRAWAQDVRLRSESV